MNSKSLMFLAAGNVPAALYHDRKSRRWSSRSIDDESVEFGASSSPGGGEECQLQPLKTFLPTRDKLFQIVTWLSKATDAELSTCKIGLATAGGGLVSWSYRTRISRPSPRTVMFTGKFGGLPAGKRFSKVVLTLSNGDEIARRALDHSIEITPDVSHVTTSYTLRFS